MTARHFVYGLCHTQHNVEKRDIWHTPPLYAVTGLLSFEGVLISSTTSRKKNKSKKSKNLQDLHPADVLCLKADAQPLPRTAATQPNQSAEYLRIRSPQLLPLRKASFPIRAPK